MLVFKSFSAATSVISRTETMYVVKKGQLISRDKSVQNQVKFIHELSEIAT